MYTSRIRMFALKNPYRKEILTLNMKIDIWNQCCHPYFINFYNAFVGVILSEKGQSEQ